MSQSQYWAYEGLGHHSSLDDGGGGFCFWANPIISVLSILRLGILVTLPSLAQARGKPHKCDLYGKIQIVEAFPDVKVQVVDAFPDIRVQRVPDFANGPGKWQIVDSLADWKVQIVEAFPDYKIQWVDAFSGCE